MRLYVGVTDFDWYSHLSARPDVDEVNFWSPGGAAFKVLQSGELFLFKLKAEHGHAIVGVTRARQGGWMFPPSPRESRPQRYALIALATRR